MFIGHYGLGLAAKRVDNRPSLGTLFLAAQFLDILWPVFVLTDLEHVKIDSVQRGFLTLHFTSYPYSHSLAAALFWSLMFGVVYYLVKSCLVAPRVSNSNDNGAGKNLKGSLVLSLLVFSHWVLDLIVHAPDLQLIPGNELKVGLGLWNSVTWTVVLESLIFVTGVYLYVMSTKAKNLQGNIGFWSLVAFLSFAYLMDLEGPPPPSITAIGIAGISQWLIIAWAYWVDRNRKSPVTDKT
jgi:hypothetical protein